jgi:hypothetical protein
MARRVDRRGSSLLGRVRDIAGILRSLPRRMAAAEAAIGALGARLRYIAEGPDSVSALRSELARLQQRLEEESVRRRAALESLAAQISAHSAELGQSLASLTAQVSAESTQWREALAPAVARSEENSRQLQVRAVMDWIERATLSTGPLISVILPTRDRCALLRRALESLGAQSYPHWEALVVDDASLDETPALLSAVGDERIKALRGPGLGTCAARNVALGHAKGELIAYLDDDNLMHPQWLKTVAWAFEQHPEADTLYGAFIVDDPERIKRVSRGALPRLFFFPYDHAAVARDNIADMGCIAHRAGLPEARFDDQLREMGDWDLFLRLTRDKPPLAVPAVACFYTTDAPNRTSNGPTHELDLATVRRKNQR